MTRTPPVEHHRDVSELDPAAAILQAQGYIVPKLPVEEDDDDDFHDEDEDLD